MESLTEETIKINGISGMNRRLKIINANPTTPTAAAGATAKEEGEDVPSCPAKHRLILQHRRYTCGVCSDTCDGPSMCCKQCDYDECPLHLLKTYNGAQWQKKPAPTEDCPHPLDRLQLQKVQCPKGHMLSLRVRDTMGWNCDLCRERHFLKGTISLWCDRFGCDYDECPHHRTALTREQSQQLQSNGSPSPTVLLKLGSPAWTPAPLGFPFKLEIQMRSPTQSITSRSDNFFGHQVVFPSRHSHLPPLRSLMKSIVCVPRFADPEGNGDPSQVYTTEMLHWDQYQMTHGAWGNNTDSNASNNNNQKPSQQKPSSLDSPLLGKPKAARYMNRRYFKLNTPPSKDDDLEGTNFRHNFTVMRRPKRGDDLEKHQLNIAKQKWLSDSRYASSNEQVQKILNPPENRREVGDSVVRDSIAHAISIRVGLRVEIVFQVLAQFRNDARSALASIVQTINSGEVGGGSGSTSRPPPPGSGFTNAPMTAEANASRYPHVSTQSRNATVARHDSASFFGGKPKSAERQSTAHAVPGTKTTSSGNSGASVLMPFRTAFFEHEDDRAAINKVLAETYKIVEDLILMQREEKQRQAREVEEVEGEESSSALTENSAESQLASWSLLRRHGWDLQAALKNHELLIDPRLRDPLTIALSFMPNPGPFRGCCRFTVDCFDYAVWLEGPISSPYVILLHNNQENGDEENGGLENDGEVEEEHSSSAMKRSVPVVLENLALISEPCTLQL